MFSRKEFQFLNKFNRIFILVSGGLDSTYTVLNMWELRFYIKRPFILLHADTKNQMKSSKKTLQKLREFVSPEWDYEEFSLNEDKKHPNSKKPLQYILESLKRIDKAHDLLLEGKYSKKVFPCCWYLKHKPFYQWTRLEDHSKDIFVSSIRGGESRQRQLFLAKLRKNNTYFHFHTSKNLWYFYPLRDSRHLQVKQFFQHHAPKQFLNIQRSSCRICPIMAMFNLTNQPEVYSRTMRVLDRITEKTKPKFILDLPRKDQGFETLKDFHLDEKILAET